MRKHGKSEIVSIGMILGTCLLILLGFFFYDSLQTPLKRNVSYILDTEVIPDTGAADRPVSSAPTEEETPAPAVSPATGDSTRSLPGSAEPISRAAGHLSDDSLVYVSPSGSKYHIRPDCGTMDPAKASSMTVAQARAAGKEPCQRCIGGD